MALSTTAKVGIITILGLVLIAAVIVWKTEILLMQRGYELIASFENVEGLTIGSEVRFRGMKVGKVLKIDPGPYDIKIYSVIDPHLKIPADSTLRVAYDGIVGIKFLEIRPGTSEVMYQPKQVLLGTRTAAIVDFVDIGSKNLVETKAILETFRKFIEDPRLQAAVQNAIFTAEKTAREAERLTRELRVAADGLAKITADPNFQEKVKGTVQETEKALSSANRFFESMRKLNLRISGGADIGSSANSVRGDVDIVQSESTYYRLGFGEGPTRSPSLLDLLLTNRLNDKFGYRLGVINTQLGGGLIWKFNHRGNLLADLYDLNNPRPKNPRLRLGYQQELQKFMDLLIQGDNLLNEGDRNFMFGVRVKPYGEDLY
ncbi:MAG: MlaD family protein [Candidatus Margulisiibacteriota bacterium]